MLYETSSMGMCLNLWLGCDIESVLRGGNAMTKEWQISWREKEQKSASSSLGTHPLQRRF
jgi:hypothetical protein